MIDVDINERLKKAMEDEKNAVEKMISLTDGQYDEVIKLLFGCEGKVVFMGIGKSGHIGEKLAATFSSTGTPSFFVHGAEACHGDFGMIEKKDIVILISNSGNTKEIVQDLPFLRNIGCKTIAMTSNKESELAKGCYYRIIFPHLPEADDINLAPTVSSTLTLVLGDAIACTLSSMRGFSRKDFYRYHPGGNLGVTLRKEVK